MKKNIKKLVCVAMMASLGTGAVMAQDAQTTSADNKKVEFSLHLGGVVPLGDFGDVRMSGDGDDIEDINAAWFDKKSDKGGAGFGANIGMKLKFNIPAVKGLGIIATADLFWNGIHSDLKDLKEDLLDEMLEGYEYEDSYYIGDDYYSYSSKREVYDAKVKIPNYLNIPIMAGVNYEYNLGNSVSLWGEGAVGLNIAKVTKLELYEEGHYYRYEYDYYSGSSETEYDYEERVGMKYDLQTTMAFQIGAGVKFGDKFSIGLHYYALGKVKLEGEYYEEYYDTEDGEDFDSEDFRLKSVSPSMFVIRLGFHF